MSIITEEQLKAILPKCKKPKEWAEIFSKIFPLYNMHINNKRMAAFIGQVAVESGELNILVELPSKYNKKDPKDKDEPTGTLYEGRKATLGNYVPGDGPKFIGRGILQITGRYNYNRYGLKLNIKLLDLPELAADPEVATRLALEYWKDRNINSHADAWNLTRCTELVNGTAKLHHDRRVHYSEAALKILNGEPNV